MTDESLISLQPGTIIGGRYEVVKCLGAGSMGLVYACRHRELSGHLVAVKVLFPEVAQDKIAAARFRNEVFASYGVSHPNVVRAYEFIKDGDLVAYTMEYVSGGDLADRLAKKEALPIPEIINILSQMCSGVQAIHDSGIVHRDLKPENIFISKEGDVKIGDFGIARTDFGPKLTEHGGVVGTIDYVSPEYMLNSHVDWRSDIYAIGILAYEMITGESPFKGDSVYAVMTQRLKTDPVPPSELRRDCPKELDRIILTAMHRDPEERYQSSAQMFYDLKELGKEKTESMRPSLEISEDESKTYVGPSLSPEEVTKIASQAGLPDSDPIAVTSTPGGNYEPTIVSEFNVPAEELEQVMEELTEEAPTRLMEESRRQERKEPAEKFIDDNNRALTTEVRSSELAQSRQHYRSAAFGTESKPMESLINPRAAKRKEPLAEDFGVQNVGIENSRLRKLSKKSRRGHSLIVDALAVVLAVAVGASVGFALLRSVKPEWLERPVSSAQPTETETIRVGGE